MTGLGSRKWVLLACIATVAVSGSIAGLLFFDQETAAHRRRHDYPPLFGAPPRCSDTAQPTRRASRLERQAHFYAERYPYDPRDGIEAVLRFQEARSCYQTTGHDGDATRVEHLAAGLMSRVSVDYAASRLALEGALSSEDWPVALSELRRLLRLTQHLDDHSYVEWLSSLLGKVTIRATDTD